jgi:pimeloyl-ACP methyl ester carboxylesterase
MTSIRTALRALAVTATACLVGLTLLSTTSSSAQPTAHRPQPTPGPTIVLVHGAWADGSSWAAVTARLQHAGFAVDVPPVPLRGLASDARYLRDYLATLTGPVVLVGHSYGGMVITSAATGNADVRALVYVNAYLPQTGDTVEQLTAARPGSELDPATAISAVPVRDADGNVGDVDLYVRPAVFPALFAAGIPAARSAVLAAAQRPLTLSALSEAFAGTPAWQTIPSWALVGTADRVLPPAEQLAMATRAHARVVTVDAPHLSMVSDPAAVAALIADAAGVR